MSNTKIDKNIKKLIKEDLPFMKKSMKAGLLLYSIIFTGITIFFLYQTIRLYPNKAGTLTMAIISIMFAYQAITYIKATINIFKTMRG